MSESSEPSPAPVFAYPWAVRLGGLILVAFAVVVAIGFYDNAHRSELEVLSETTSVGDKLFLPIPDPSRLPVVAANLAGKPLSVASEETVEVRDSHTRHLAHDTAAGVHIYELSEAATDAERAKVGTPAPAFLLKTGIGQYLVARPTAP